MKHISILVASGSNLGSIENPRHAFLVANQYLKSLGKPPAFKIQLVGITKEVQLNNGMYTVHTDVELKNLKKTDLIIIPAFFGDISEGVKKSNFFVPWVVKQYNAGAEIASLCVGAFLLAATGLLNGRNCSTHWRAAKEFRLMFPEVQLITEKVITDENGIYTSGGAFSSANLILYLIEKYAGRETAIHCSKIFQVDMERKSQSPFMIFKGQKDHEDEPVKKAQDFIETNFQNKITVDQLASMLALSRRNLERRFKRATANTVIEYIQRVKVEAAKMSLESSRENVNEVMYNVGYQDPKAFRNTFKRITGLSPIQYRNKYSKAAI